jgi:hypothetical protein
VDFSTWKERGFNVDGSFRDLLTSTDGLRICLSLQMPSGNGDLLNPPPDTIAGALLTPLTYFAYTHFQLGDRCLVPQGKHSAAPVSPVSYVVDCYPFGALPETREPNARPKVPPCDLENSWRRCSSFRTSRKHLDASDQSRSAQHFFTVVMIQYQCFS